MMMTNSVQQGPQGKSSSGQIKVPRSLPWGACNVTNSCAFKRGAYSLPTVGSFLNSISCQSQLTNWIEHTKLLSCSEIFVQLWYHRYFTKTPDLTQNVELAFWRCHPGGGEERQGTYCTYLIDRKGWQWVICIWVLQLTWWPGPSSDHAKYPKWTKDPDHAGGIERRLWDEVDNEFHVKPIHAIIHLAISLVFFICWNSSTGSVISRPTSRRKIGFFVWIPMVPRAPPLLSFWMPRVTSRRTIHTL